MTLALFIKYALWAVLAFIVYRTGYWIGKVASCR